MSAVLPSPVILLLALLCSSVTASINIVEYRPKSGSVDIKEGSTFELWCNVDSWWEWCTFTRHGLDAEDARLCDFQWLNSVYNVTVLDCDAFQGRFEFIADYNSYECGVRFYDAQPADSGRWTCAIESYYSGKTRNYGYNASQEFNVAVQAKPTTTTTTTTSTTTTTTATPPSTPWLSSTTANRRPAMPRSGIDSKFDAVSLDADGSHRQSSTYSDYNDPNNPVMLSRGHSLFALALIAICIILIGAVICFLILTLMHSRRLLPPKCDQMVVPMLNLASCGLLRLSPWSGSAVGKGSGHDLSDGEAADGDHEAGVGGKIAHADFHKDEICLEDGAGSDKKHGTIVRPSPACDGTNAAPKATPSKDGEGASEEKESLLKIEGGVGPDQSASATTRPDGGDPDTTVTSTVA